MTVYSRTCVIRMTPMEAFEHHPTKGTEFKPWRWVDHDKTRLLVEILASDNAVEVNDGKLHAKELVDREVDTVLGDRVISGNVANPDNAVTNYVLKKLAGDPITEHQLGKEESQNVKHTENIVMSKSELQQSNWLLRNMCKLNSQWKHLSERRIKAVMEKPDGRHYVPIETLESQGMDSQGHY